MDYIWVFFAFACGIGAKNLALPPTIGYLIAGFVLHLMHLQASDTIYALSDLGITLMLFMIGLKLNISDLLKKEVWQASLSHTLVWIIAALFVVKVFVAWGVSYFTDLELHAPLLIAFALSFSSTVAVMKLMEDNGEVKTRHGKLAISILVMQDIFAVIFLVVATGKTPSIYALALPLLLLVKPILSKLVNRIGHGELIPLAGFFIALGSYELFELVNIKGDLGALLAGIYLGSNQKSVEIYKSLVGFKDLFLIGFYLSIGFTALPTWDMLLSAVLLITMIPFKFLLFFFVLSQIGLRSRTAFLVSVALSNFSEFGLIVAALSAQNGWLSIEWLVILSLSVAISFLITNILYRYVHPFYSRHKMLFKRLENPHRLLEDIVLQPTASPILVVGLGRVGMGAYNALKAQVDSQVWALDADKTKIAKLRSEGVKVYFGDAEDLDFWESLNLNDLKLVLLALPSVEDIKNITSQIRASSYSGKIAAIARYDDERAELEEYGIDKVFNFYTEAGVGFAEESLNFIRHPFTRKESCD